VIENEAGPVSLDDKLLAVHSGSRNSGSAITTVQPIIVTSGGCVCCKVRGDLVKGLLTLSEFQIDQSESAEENESEEIEKGLDCIFLEASGLAEVKPIIQTFYDSKVQRKVSLESVITVVDCTNPMTENKEFFQQQLLLADVIILNKKNLVPSASFKRTLHSVISWNPTSTIKVVENGHVTLCDINPSISEHFSLVKNRLHLIENERITHDSGEKQNHLHDAWSTIALEAHGLVHLKLLQQWLRNISLEDNSADNGFSIYRGKGLIRHVEGILEVQIVGAHVSLNPVMNETILEENEPSILVLIAPCLKHEKVREELSAGFQRCFPGFYMNVFLTCREFICDVLMGAFVKISSGLIDLARGRIDTFFKAHYS